VNEQKNPNSPKKQPDNSYMQYSGMAIQMVVIILAGVWAGKQLDKWLAFKFPIFTLILSLLSVFGAVYYVVKDFLKKK
jgi:hypothetical protein